MGGYRCRGVVIRIVGKERTTHSLEPHGRARIVTLSEHPRMSVDARVYVPGGSVKWNCPFPEISSRADNPTGFLDFDGYREHGLSRPHYRIEHAYVAVDRSLLR